MKFKNRTIRDAVHGDIPLDEHEMRVISTPEYQRMRGIRQLGLGHLVYPCAHHTRFEHSIGVAHMAARIIAAIRANGGTISEQEEGFARALALVHDIGHVPFGHTLEDERPVFPKSNHHDDALRLGFFLSNTELGAALGIMGNAIGHHDLVSDLIRVMKRTHEEDDTGDGKLTARETLIAEIVGNTICADLLDYLSRDPIFTGLQHRYDQRIISAFNVNDNQIYLDLDDNGDLRNSIASEILHLLRLRYTLGERVYYHPTKSSASAMISKAVELSELSHRSLVPLRDEELLLILEDAERLGLILPEKIQNAAGVQHIVKLLRARRLYVPAYTITRHAAGPHRQELVRRYYNPENIAQRRTTEASLAQHLGLKPEQVIIYCPHDSMATKPAMVRVRWPKVTKLEALEVLCKNEFGFEDETAGMEIAQLKRKHAALWRMTVFLDPTATEKENALKALCQDEFFDIPDSNAKSNYAARAIKGELMLEAICKDTNPETLDLSKCFSEFQHAIADKSAVPGSLDAKEIRRSLPRLRSPGEPHIAGVDPQPPSRKGRRTPSDVGVNAHDIIAKRLTSIMTKMRMPEVQKKNAEPLLPRTVDLVCTLSEDLQERLFADLEADATVVQGISHNRLNGESFMAHVQSRAQDLIRPK